VRYANSEGRIPSGDRADKEFTGHIGRRSRAENHSKAAGGGKNRKWIAGIRLEKEMSVLLDTPLVIVFAALARIFFLPVI
jgi:hypothetical protein